MQEPDIVDEASLESELEHLVDRAREAGFSDDRIAEILERWSVHVAD